MTLTDTFDTHIKAISTAEEWEEYKAMTRDMDEFAMRNFSEAMKRVGKAARELSDRLTQNNKAMKYRVTTRLLNDYFLNEDISKSEYKKLIEQGVPKSWFEPVKQVEDGDYWHFIKSNHIVRIDRIRDDKCEVVYIDNNQRGQWFISEIANRAVKLSTHEIESALIKEAKRRGFEIGKCVNNENLGYCYNKRVENGEYGFKYYKRDDLLSFGDAYIYKQGKWASIVDQTPHIEINGYEAEFHDEYVKFGCAKIDKKFFTEMYNEDTDSWHYTGAGNTHVTGIRWGKGVFELEDIKAIAEYYE